MKILIAILSCHANTHGIDRGSELREAQRQTWLRDLLIDRATLRIMDRFEVDYRFILGRGQDIPKLDESWLDVPDDYDSLPIKSLALISRAYEHGYDFLFKCDDDTYCRVDRLFESGFEAHDYSGYRKVSPWFGGPIEFAQGGAGYWLSRKAMAATLEPEVKPSITWGPEDLNVARLLKFAGIFVHHDSRYQWTMDRVPSPGNDVITSHRCTPQDLRFIHSQWQPD